jgi:predicted AlkP superfamily phosphohydrolase/phosphomutase
MTRTLVIGLELGDGSLLLEGARSGRLPRLRALLERGVHGLLGTTAEQLHVSAWPSLYTGASPGRHGVYFTFQPAPGVQGHQRFHDGLYGAPTVWRLLAEAGKRCTVMDAPYSHGEPGYGGPQLIDWGCWARYLPTQSRPPGLLADLRRARGDYPLGLEAHDIGLAAIDAAEMEGRILKALPAKARAATWLMGTAPWDLFLVVLGETHPAAHYCWCPGDPAQARLMRIYEAVDRAVGELVDAAGPEAAVILVSGDAVGPNNAGWHLLPEALARLGVLASAEHGRPRGGAPPAAARFDPVKAVRDLLPKGFRKSLARLLPTALRDRLAKHVDTAAIDWARTRAFCLPTDLEGLIRVNLRGREPLGTVEPGAPYERLLDELTAAMRALSDPATGRPVVAEVIRADDAFPGDRRAWLPDLIVTWDRNAPITAIASPAIGTVVAPSPDGRPGTHKGPGFALAAGPGIPASQRLERGHILDLCPTLLARHGIAAPGSVEGRPWPALVPSLSGAAAS